MGLRPDIEPMRLLLEEDRLPLVVAQAGEVAVVGPIEELAACVLTLAGQQVALIIAVEMNLEGLAGGIVALEKLGLDLRLAGGRDERRRPILGREDLVDLAVRLPRGRASGSSAGTR